MRKVHIIFGAIAAIWVPLYTFLLISDGHETEYAVAIGRAMGHLILLAIPYGIYIFLTRKKKTTIEKS